MLFGGSHFGFGIYIGAEEIQHLKEKFSEVDSSSDTYVMDILEFCVYPKIEEAIRPTCHPNNLRGFHFHLSDHHVKNGYFLMLSSTCYTTDKESPFVSISSDEDHDNTLTLHCGEIERWYIEEFQEITGITKKWEWALISSFY